MYTDIKYRHYTVRHLIWLIEKKKNNLNVKRILQILKSRMSILNIPMAST